MIRSSNHSSYPRVGDSPLDQQLRAVLRARERGVASEEDVAAAADEATTVVVAEQSRAFIDIVTDGMVSWDGPHSRLARHLAGLEQRELRRWFHTDTYDRRVAVVADIVHERPFLLHDHEIARSVAAERSVKLVLPGPVTFARLAIDDHYRDRDRLADAMAGALAAEVRALAGAGARFFQLDEPSLCRHPEDLDRVARTASVVFEAAGAGATTILSTYFGTLSAAADRWDRLPGTHLGLDLTGPAPDLELLPRLPDGRGVVLGLFDCGTTVQEDADDVAQRLEPYRDALVERDVIVGPNAGLELLPRDAAFDKLLHARYLVEKLSKDWTWRS